jgi:predicted secreted protein
MLSASSLCAQNKIFYDTDSGKDVHLKVGDRVELHLKANPSTGFMWYLQKESTPLMKLTGQTQTQPETPMPGASVFQVFFFEAKEAGDGIMHMHYVRSWEKPTPADTIFTLHVIVE